MRNPEVSTAADYSLWDDGDPEEAAAQNSAAVEEPLELTVGRDGARRLDKWLAEQLTDYSRVRLQTWIGAGAVQVDGQVASTRQPLFADQVVRIVPQAQAEDLAFVPEQMQLPIVFEDEALLVVDKPAGLVVHPAAGNWSGTLLNGLLHYLPSLNAVPRAGIVHRLDKDTTGLMVVAKTTQAQIDLVRQLQARSVHREYLALALGEPHAKDSLDGWIGRHPRERLKMAVLANGATGARPALTHFRVLARGHLGPAPVALLAVRLETGRTHQIRVHMSHAGFPLIGDQVYASSGARALFTRQALHAGRLGLDHPSIHTPVHWSSSPTDDFIALLEKAGVLEGLDDF